MSSSMSPYFLIAVTFSAKYTVVDRGSMIIVFICKYENLIN